MRRIASPSLGVFRLKCASCAREYKYVTGGNLLELGDYPDEVACPFCKRKHDSFVVEVPTVLDYSTVP